MSEIRLPRAIRPIMIYYANKDVGCHRGPAGVNTSEHSTNSENSDRLEARFQQILASVHAQGAGLSRQMYDHFQKLGDSVSRIQEEICEMKQDVGENRSDISKLQQDSAFVHQKIDFLEHRLERMDTSSRGRNLKFFGIYEPGPWEHWNDVGEIVAVLNNFSKRW